MILDKEEYGQKIKVVENVSVTHANNAWTKAYEYTVPVDGFYALFCRARWANSRGLRVDITNNTTSPTGYDDIAMSEENISSTSAVVYQPAGTKICFYGIWEGSTTDTFDVHIKYIGQ